MSTLILDRGGLPWLDYGYDVYHCPRCHRVVRVYDFAEDRHPFVQAMHNEVWHSEPMLEVLL